MGVGVSSETAVASLVAIGVSSETVVGSEIVVGAAPPPPAQATPIIAARSNAPATNHILKIVSLSFTVTVTVGCTVDLAGTSQPSP